MGGKINHDVTATEIVAAYNRYDSVKQTAQSLGVSWNRVVKALSSAGVIINNDHQRIVDMYDTGKNAGEIVAALGCSVKKVEAYLPRRRPPYYEERSENALRIQRCRERKEDLG